VDFRLQILRGDDLVGPLTHSPLESGEVHVWIARTDVDADETALSSDERERASRFHFQGHRQRWIAARLMLRRVLAGYLDIRPHTVRFAYSSYGKPALAGGHALQFNLSNSGDVAVCAVSLSRHVGADVERIRPIDDMDGVFRRICSHGEARIWDGLTAPERVEAFFRSWTVKESCAKAVGLGFSTPVDEIEVLTQAVNARFVLCGGRAWQVIMFEPCVGYAGALAVQHG
jgi:4'-phosphopantetheinyl transferase